MGEVKQADPQGTYFDYPLRSFRGSEAASSHPPPSVDAPPGMHEPHYFHDGTSKFHHANAYGRADPEMKRLLKENGTLTKWRLLRKQRAKFLDHFNKPDPPPLQKAPTPPEATASASSLPTEPKYPAAVQRAMGQSASVPSLHGQKPQKRWKPKSANFQPPKGWDAFLKRQQTFSTEATQYWTSVQLKHLEQQQIDAKSLGLDLCNLGVDGFRTMLVHRFGSVVRGWRHGLDVSGDGKLSFSEFCTACRNIGYAGKIKHLWKKLDSDGSGVVTLDELDSEAYHGIELFKALCRKKYGNTLKAWSKALDKDGNEHLDPDEFAERVTTCLEYPNDPHKLYQWLLPHSGKAFLTLEDVDPHAALAKERGDENMVTVSHHYQPKRAPLEMTFEERQTNINVVWNTAVSKMQRARVEEVKAKVFDADLGAKTLVQFKRQLVAKYGSLYQAWRYGLDRSGDGKLCFQEFCMACRDNDFRGSLLALWNELDDDGSGVVSLGEFDPRAHDELEGMRAFLIERYGNMLKAWKEGLDVDGNFRVDEHEWMERLKEMGFDGDAAYLFHLLKPRARHYLTLEDFDHHATLAQFRGDETMMTMEKLQHEPLKMTFDERQQATFQLRWKKQLSKDKMARFRERDAALEAADIGAHDLQGFKRLLIRRFGSLYRAWRKGLDTSGDNKLSFIEFTDACRAIGYAGNLKKLWKELDDDDSGVISLEEIDEEVAFLVHTFYTRMNERFNNNMIRAWVQLDPKKTQRCDEKVFVSKMVEWGILGQKDAKKMFVQLLDDPLKPYLSLMSIDKQAYDCLLRGDHNMTTLKAKEHKTPTQMTFEERQATHRSVAWKRELAQQQLAHIQEAERAKKAADLGASTLAAFKRLLVTRFGSILVAWRRALDTSGDGKLSFTEFTHACRGVGYVGSLQKLWGELDKDGSGVITLDELDLVANQQLQAFFDILQAKYGRHDDEQGIFTAWVEFFEPDRTGQLELYKFVKKCKELGYGPPEHAPAEDLVKALVPDDRAAYLKLRDLDKNAHLRLVSEFNDRLEAERKRKAFHAKDIGAKDLSSFKALLVHRYGNIARAWRKGLDVSGDGKLSFTEFTGACRALGYKGVVKVLWKELDADGSGVVSLEELDPETHVTLTSFRELLNSQFGNTLRAWHEGLDMDKNDRVDRDEFLERCKALGYEGNAEKLFDMLSESGKNYLSLSDVDPEAEKARERGDWDMLGANLGSKSPSNKLSFNERQEHHRAQVIRTVMGKDVRQGIEKWWEHQESIDMCGSDVEGFRKLLRHRYGTTVAAWALGLDRIGAGRLSWTMFCKGCRNIGFVGNFKKVWKMLDDDDSGVISLQELDKPAADALREFRDMTHTLFSTDQATWDDLAEGQSHVDLPQFIKKMKQYGYKQDAKQLFNWIKIERKNRWLLPNDLTVIGRLFPKEVSNHWKHAHDKVHALAKMALLDKHEREQAHDAVVQQLGEDAEIAYASQKEWDGEGGLGLVEEDGTFVRPEDVPSPTGASLEASSPGPSPKAKATARSSPSARSGSGPASPKSPSSPKSLASVPDSIGS